MKTLLIYHEGARLEEEVMLRWLASFSDLVGLIVLGVKGQKVEAAAAGDQASWSSSLRRRRRFPGLLQALSSHETMIGGRVSSPRELGNHFGPPTVDTPVLRTDTPNSDEAVEFIHRLAPDMMIARCKTLLAPQVFSDPAERNLCNASRNRAGVWNSHGCFWALSNRDLDKVGMTLLRIDAGVDTGPVYGYFSYEYDEGAESHSMIQKRVVFENLDAIRERLLEIERGDAEPIDTSGRVSGAWGQPWLTKYLMWKWRARRAAVRTVTLLYHDVVAQGQDDASGFPGAGPAR